MRWGPQKQRELSSPPLTNTQTLSSLWLFCWRQKLQRRAKEGHFVWPTAEALV